MPAPTLVSCLILGGGGHARVLIDCMRACGILESVAILDRDPDLWGQEMLTVPVLGGDELLGELAAQGATNFLVGLGGTGDNRPRRQLFELGLSHGLAPMNVIHPSAVCSPWAKLGNGSVVLPKAVINAGALLGDNVIVNTGAIVEHDCEIGNHAHVATGASLCSTVKVGIGAHIGAGATVRQLISIGEGAIVGAGAVVVKDVDPWTVVVGVPAHS
ncbi:acetyltransferase [SAR202 cluster bacterium AD-802-F09_MRT_200m]|nr:acetyltransferase [SAR202 cluster bacterium AD-802-F09_MRT_200m]